uniref:Uncharacterized protein n=1 Tax=Megaviridae environmental sample TaxID=1737588 RepID=A0A5J6VMQ0_9VIRU|nr:MAG: hypothetical protein [Megaviridae environmental sample]
MKFWSKEIKNEDENYTVEQFSVKRKIVKQKMVILSLIIFCMIIYLAIANHIWIGKKCGENKTILRIVNLFWAGWVWLIRKINPEIMGCEKD